MRDDQLGPVTIGAREIYDAVMRLESQVGKLVDRAEAADDRHLDHETRLRTLERARWPLPSLALLVSVAALVVPVVTR